MAAASVERMDAVTGLISNLRQTYPDAKKLKLDITYQWRECPDIDSESELVPVVQIEIER